MTTRSATLFALELAAGGGQTLWVVPQGITAIWKTLVVANPTGTPVGRFDYGVLRSAVYHPLSTISDLAANTQVYQEFWVVIEAGDLIAGSLDSGPITLWASGALLPQVIPPGLR